MISAYLGRKQGGYMSMDVVKVSDFPSGAAAIQRPIEILESGGLVVFPTETVYGLAARADCPAAMDRLRQAKSRGPRDAFTVHIGSPSDVRLYASNLSALAARFVRKGWPGPLTLIVDAAAPPETGLDERTVNAIYYNGAVGLRCPEDELARLLLCGVSAPVVAASANLAGVKPPRDAYEVVDALGDLADIVVDAGPTRYAKASTIVRVNGSSYTIVREGVYDRRILDRLSKVRLLFVCTGNTCRSPMAAGLAKKSLADRVGCTPEGLRAHGVEVESAGVTAGFGGASLGAIAAMEMRGVDLSRHVSQRVTKEMLSQADHIFAMTRAHLSALAAMAPDYKHRVKLLLGDREVTDPIGGSSDFYETCAGTIEQGLEECLREVDV